MPARAAIDGFHHHHDHLGLILAVSRLGELRLPPPRRIGLYAEMHSQLNDLGLAGRNSAWWPVPLPASLTPA